MRVGLVGLAMHAGCMASSGTPIYLIDADTEVIHLSDRAQGPNARLLVEVEAVALPGPDPELMPSTPPAGSRHSRRVDTVTASDSPWVPIVNQAAVANRIEPELLHAMIGVESGRDARAISSRGARGLMQLMPATARDYGVRDPFDPQQNIAAGARHLRRLLDRFDQDKSLALAAYNAGPEAVARHHGQIPPYAETMAYVPLVLQRYAVLQRQPRAVPPVRHAWP